MNDAPTNSQERPPAKIILTWEGGRFWNIHRDSQPSAQERLARFDRRMAELKLTTAGSYNPVFSRNPRKIATQDGQEVVVALIVRIRVNEDLSYADAEARLRVLMQEMADELDATSVSLLYDRRGGFAPRPSCPIASGDIA